MRQTFRIRALIDFRCAAVRGAGGARPENASEIVQNLLRQPILDVKTTSQADDDELRTIGSAGGPARCVEFGPCARHLRSPDGAGRPPGQRLHLRDPQHRGRGQEGRGRGPRGPVPEHRRSDPVRIRRRRRTSSRPWRARCVTDTTATRRRRAFSRRAKRSRTTSPSRGFPVTRRSRPAHVRHLGRHRAHARRAGRRRTTRCWCRCRLIRSTRRCSRSSARARCTTAPIRREDWQPDVDHIAQPRSRRGRARSC